MIHVDFDPNSLQGDDKLWWDAWCKKAENATQKLVQTWTKNGKIDAGDFNTDIWKELKDWLKVNVFSYKCAYCETIIERSWEEAEHFRPKGKVNYVSNGKPQNAKVIDNTGKAIDHPGYFWLAYNWQNLLPSCQYCNNHKRNQFPTEKEQYIFAIPLTKAEYDALNSPALELVNWPNYYLLDSVDLDQREKRTLLHPIFDNPEDHLKFGIKGTVTYLSPKGENSINVYKLSEERLDIARHKTQFSALCEYWDSYYKQEAKKLGDNESFRVVREHTADRVISEVKANAHDWAYIKAICDYMEAQV